MEQPTDWRIELGELIEEHRFTPHEWGEHDCALWAAKARAVAKDGIDFGDPYRGTYSNGLGAAKQMMKLDGCKTVVELADRKCGERSHIAEAQAGDVVVGNVGPEDTPALGICFGSHSFFVGDEGLLAYPTLSLEHCYHG